MLSAKICLSKALRSPLVSRPCHDGAGALAVLVVLVAPGDLKHLVIKDHGLSISC